MFAGLPSYSKYQLQTIQNSLTNQPVSSPTPSFARLHCFLNPQLICSSVVGLDIFDGQDTTISDEKQSDTTPNVSASRIISLESEVGLDIFNGQDMTISNEKQPDTTPNVSASPRISLESEPMWPGISVKGLIFYGLSLVVLAPHNDKDLNDKDIVEIMDENQYKMPQPTQRRGSWQNQTDLTLISHIPGMDAADDETIISKEKPSGSLYQDTTLSHATRSQSTQVDVAPSESENKRSKDQQFQSKGFKTSSKSPVLSKRCPKSAKKTSIIPIPAVVPDTLDDEDMTIFNQKQSDSTPSDILNTKISKVEEDEYKMDNLIRINASVLNLNTHSKTTIDLVPDFNEEDTTMFDENDSQDSHLRHSLEGSSRSTGDSMLPEKDKLISKFNARRPSVDNSPTPSHLLGVKISALDTHGTTLTENKEEGWLKEAKSNIFSDLVSRKVTAEDKLQKPVPMKITSSTTQFSNPFPVTSYLIPEVSQQPKTSSIFSARTKRFSKEFNISATSKNPESNGTNDSTLIQSHFISDQILGVQDQEITSLHPESSSNFKIIDLLKNSSDAQHLEVGLIQPSPSVSMMDLTEDRLLYPYKSSSNSKQSERAHDEKSMILNVQNPEVYEPEINGPEVQGPKLEELKIQRYGVQEPEPKIQEPVPKVQGPMGQEQETGLTRAHDSEEGRENDLGVPDAPTDVLVTFTSYPEVAELPEIVVVPLRATSKEKTQGTVEAKTLKATKCKRQRTVKRELTKPSVHPLAEHEDKDQPVIVKDEPDKIIRAALEELEVEEKAVEQRVLKCRPRNSVEPKKNHSQRNTDSLQTGIMTFPVTMISGPQTEPMSYAANTSTASSFYPAGKNQSHPGLQESTEKKQQPQNTVETRKAFGFRKDEQAAVHILPKGLDLDSPIAETDSIGILIPSVLNELEAEEWKKSFKSERKMRGSSRENQKMHCSKRKSTIRKLVVADRQKNILCFLPPGRKKITKEDYPVVLIQSKEQQTTLITRSKKERGKSWSEACHVAKSQHSPDKKIFKTNVVRTSGSSTGDPLTVHDLDVEYPADSKYKQLVTAAQKELEMEQQQESVQQQSEQESGQEVNPNISRSHKGQEQKPPS
eukprot:gi/632947345/ref/XP_007889002.1/ PREDICTED: uncharacterized protein LOC103176927 [Callorhinchus milii]